MILDILKKLFEALLPSLLERRRIRFEVHRAAFRQTGRQAFFFDLANLSKSREIEVTRLD